MISRYVDGSVPIFYSFWKNTGLHRIVSSSFSCFIKWSYISKIWRSRKHLKKTHCRFKKKKRELPEVLQRMKNSQEWVCGMPKEPQKLTFHLLVTSGLENTVSVLVLFENTL